MTFPNVNGKGRLTLVFGVAIVSGALFLLGVGVGRYDWLPVNQVVALAKAIGKEITVRKAGGENYTREVLDQQLPKSLATEVATARRIDTSRVPLLLNVIALTKNGNFYGSGAIANVEGTLVVMDGLGNIFSYSNNSLQKIDLGEFPNNLIGFIKKSRFPLSGNTLRTHYIAYDSAMSTIYVSFEKYDPVSKGARFNVSAITIDKKTLKKTGGWHTIFESEDVTTDSYAGNSGGGHSCFRELSLFHCW